MKTVKTFILKYNVLNNDNFPKGTVVKITDDYWGGSSDKKNTGFTVTQGKLKGKKGCVVDGLEDCLLDNTRENRKAVADFKKQISNLESEIQKLKKDWDKMPTAKL